jgi:hypothetical protein
VRSSGLDFEDDWRECDARIGSGDRVLSGPLDLEEEEFRTWR